MKTPENETRYAVHPGVVISINDGDKHFIGYRKLIQLYGVDPSLCFDASRPMALEGCKPGQKIVHLYPDFSGSYELI